MRFIKEPNIIDVEASGFGSESYPIEIGVALNCGRKFCTLVLPIKEWVHWDESAEKIHKVSRQDLKAYGKPIYEVTFLLNNFLKGMTVYSDGWVVDKPWLSTLFYASGRPMMFNVSPIEMILSEKQMEVWHETKTKLSKQEKITRHRASNDAWLIQQTFNKTKEIIKNRKRR